MTKEGKKEKARKTMCDIGRWIAYASARALDATGTVIGAAGDLMLRGAESIDLRLGYKGKEQKDKCPGRENCPGCTRDTRGE